jgi:hypothetical protein
VLEGRAWSGGGGIDRVEVSIDGGLAWHDAHLGPLPDDFVWRAWTYGWAAEPGEYELLVRATDGLGVTQPLDGPWNLHGFENTLVQRVPVTVRRPA